MASNIIDSKTNVDCPEIDDRFQGLIPADEATYDRPDVISVHSLLGENCLDRYEGPD